MSRLLLGGLELQADDLWGEVILGGPDDLAEWVGEDDDVPEASGMDAGLFRASKRIVKIELSLWPDGATAAARRAAFRTLMASVIAKMQPDTLISIVAHPPNFGLTTGETATLANCRPQRLSGPTRRGDEQRIQTILELVSIDSPPDWTIA